MPQPYRLDFSPRANIVLLVSHFLLLPSGSGTSGMADIRMDINVLRFCLWGASLEFIRRHHTFWKAMVS